MRGTKAKALRKQAKEEAGGMVTVGMKYKELKRKYKSRENK